MIIIIKKGFFLYLSEGVYLFILNSPFGIISSQQSLTYFKIIEIINKASCGDERAKSIIFKYLPQYRSIVFILELLDSEITIVDVS